MDADEFEYRLGLHCKELFELNSNGFFDGFELIGSKLCENVFVDGCDDKQDVIVYRCTDCDGLYVYGITVSFDGSVIYGREIVNVFRNARFGEKFVTDKGYVLIYGRRIESVKPSVIMDTHFLMGEHSIYYVYDNGNFVTYDGISIDDKVVGRLGGDDLDVIKVYVKKELCDRNVGGYMQGFIDGYKNCVIG